MKIHTFRLKAGSKLRSGIQQYAKEKEISAGTILSIVGGTSLTNLRMPGAKPDKQDIKKFEGEFEIVSVQGTLSKKDCHIHISLGDKEGKVFGGHLKEAEVRVTAEVTILELTDRKFLRKLDKETGFEELVVKQKT